MQKNLLPGDPRPIDLKSTLAILVCHTWFQRDQIDGGFRRSSQHLRNQLTWKVRAQNTLLNRAASHVLHFDEGRVSRFREIASKASPTPAVGTGPFAALICDWRGCPL